MVQKILKYSQESLEDFIGRGMEESSPRKTFQVGPKIEVTELFVKVSRLWQLSSHSRGFLSSSVPDPNPDPPDPRVFWPPGSGSGSTSQRYGSGSFYLHAKIIRKIWILLFCDSFWLFIFKNNVNVPSKSNKQKKLCSKISFLVASWRSMTKLAGSGSTGLRHGSADPDPDTHQNVMDPVHCFLGYRCLNP